MNFGRLLSIMLVAVGNTVCWHRLICLHGKLSSTLHRSRFFCMAKTPCTITTETEFCQVIKKSKFVGRAAPATSSEDAVLYIQRVSDGKATHNCWAYRTLEGGRCSDDGEPGGTAGRPILKVLESHNILNAVVVVTRYYGGIKLGSGGLSRAYASSAQGAISMQSTVPIVAMVDIQVIIDMDSIGAMHAYLQQLGAKSGTIDEISETFVPPSEGRDRRAGRMEFKLRVAEEALPAFKATLQSICKGNVEFVCNQK
mgnify:CR=1 FL=1